MILAPGSALGGTRPKASVSDRHNRLMIAKFPRETDAYGIETWEEVALCLAERAGITTPGHELRTVMGKPVLLLLRFDRNGSRRIPFLSALAMTESRDGDTGSYPEIADAISGNGARAREDAAALYRRMAFNVLISNVDDHLRNHGFLRHGKAGWSLSPACDLNPTPTDIRPCILSTNINLYEAACSLDLVAETAEYFGLSLGHARKIIREVATATSSWRDVARTAGARPQEIERMASAFEHDDLSRALAL